MARLKTYKLLNYAIYLELFNMFFYSAITTIFGSCIQDAGSDRKTVNGWTSWKTASGQTLADLREKLLNTSTNEE